MRAVAREQGVHLLDEDEWVSPATANRGAIQFLGCTLWTDFKLFGATAKAACLREGRDRLNDFRLIREGVERFSPERSVELHEQSLAWLKTQLAIPFDGKTVVMSHHLPSMQSVAERYQDDRLSACFASELKNLFGNMDLWIHGHTHDNMDYQTAGTRVICNPRGYVTHRGIENPNFIHDLVVEI
jgi:hypothetical protein